jgi:hypothetical protein
MKRDEEDINKVLGHRAGYPTSWQAGLHEVLYLISIHFSKVCLLTAKECVLQDFLGFARSSEFHLRRFGWDHRMYH